MKRFFPLLFLLVLSCKDKDNPADNTPKKILSFSIKSINTKSTDNWIIIRDNETGALIDFKSYENGDALLFESSAQPKSLAVTLFTKQIGAFTGHIIYTADTYTDVTVASDWAINPDTTVNKIGANLGNYTLHITDLPTNKPFYGPSVTDENGTSNITITATTNTVDITDVPIHDGSPTQLAAITSIEGPRYLMIDNLTAGTKTVSYKSFKNFDKIVTASFPKSLSVGFGVSAFDNKKKPGISSGYRLTSDFNLFEPVDEVSLPFLNSFPIYNIYLFAGDDYYYELQGPAPTSIEYIDPSGFTVTDRSLSNFDMTASHNYEYRYALYNYTDSNNTSVQLTFYAPPGIKKQFQPLPPELLSQYPDINLSPLEFNGAYVYAKERSYQDFLADKFKHRVDYSIHDTFERIRISVQ